MKKFYLTTLMLSLGIGHSFAQLPISITQLNVPHIDNMDSLANSGTTASTPLPAGWYFIENVNIGSLTYRIGTGSANNGDTYSFGAANASDRAFGSVASGTVQSTLCAYYINNTGAIASNVRIQFTMEQWRSGGRTNNITDSTEFFWGINNVTHLPTSGLWTKNSALNLTSKIIGGAAAALDGNDTTNQIKYDITISNVNLQNGDTLFLRWRDQDIAQSDDGLAIDDFSITFMGNVSQPQPLQTLTFVANDSRSARVDLTRGTYIANTMSTLVFIKKDNPITQGTPSLAPSAYNANTNFALANSRFENDTAARCVLIGDDASVTITGLEANTTYHLLAYVVRDIDSIYSTAKISSGKTHGNPDFVASLMANTLNQTEVLLSWQKPMSYTNTNYTTLIFAKPDTNILFQLPTFDATSYIGQTNFALATSAFEHDNAAKCVYNGDDTQITITGLDTNRKYHFMVLVYRLSDSLYSTPVLDTVQTFDMNFVPRLSSITVSQIDSTTALVKWNLPDFINQVESRVMVFIKANDPIVLGTPTRAPLAYIANSIFGLGTPYENDAAAFAIYTGKLDSVLITGLSSATTYHLVGFVVRSEDSAYAAPTNANFSTLLGPVMQPTNVNFTPTLPRTGVISWQKPADYNNATHTTLVFARVGDSIETNVPLTNTSAYNAIGVIGLGTPYDFDNSATCIFKGDTNIAVITNMPAAGSLSFVVHIVRETDQSNALPISYTYQIPSLPITNIGNINTTNPTTGVPDSLGRNYLIKGVVIGFNQRLTGLQFLLRDATGGITILSTTTTFGYNVNEGDTVQCSGVVSVVRGLTTFTADTLWRTFSHSGPFVDIPLLVQRLDENSENKLVRIVKPVRFLSQPGGSNWPSASSNILVVDALTNLDTFVVRVLAISGLAGKPLPTTPVFFVQGIGTQNSTSATAPFAFNGYQLMPRGENDVFAADSLMPFSLLSPINNTVINPDSPFTGTIVATWQQATVVGNLPQPVYTFELDSAGSDFSIPIFSINSDMDGFATSITLQEVDVIGFFSTLGLLPGQTYHAVWRVRANSDYANRLSSQSFNIAFTMPFPSSVSKVGRAMNLKVYPNPTTQLIMVESSEPISQILITDMQGRVAIPATNTKTIDVRNLPKGIYLIQITASDGHIALSRFVKE
jgi:hypothetical protein